MNISFLEKYLQDSPPPLQHENKGHDLSTNSTQLLSRVGVGVSVSWHYSSMFSFIPV